MTYAGLLFTAQFEGLRLAAYQDAGGIWTVGYGHTGPDVTPGRTVSEEEARRLLGLDLGNAETWVSKLVTAPLTQNQFDALVDFCFNVGCGNFQRSSLLRFVNMRQYALAAEEFPKWAKAGGIVQPGLERRRAAEKALFLRAE